MSVKLCGIYARVSTERQSIIKDGSLDTQISRLKGYISYRKPVDKNNDWRVVSIYKESGKSGKNIERPQLQKLIADVSNGIVNTVIVTKIDRITRSLLDFYRLMELFEKHNAEFISLEDNFDTSVPMGKAMLKITLVFAELEREQTAKRTRDKMAWRATQGLWNGGHVLGYDLKDKKLIINKDEGKIVKLIFEKYLELGSLKAVADYLNSHGYRTKYYISKKKGKPRGGQKFFITNVKQKLTNSLYIGQITYKGNVYKGQHKPIIDKRLWNSVQKTIQLISPRRKNIKKKTVHTYLLQGLMRCGWCDSFMAPKYSTGRNKLHPYYQCTRNSRFGKKDDCQMKYVPAEQLEKLVVEQLKKLSHDKKIVKDIVAKANKNADKGIRTLVSDKKVLENKLKPINAKIDSLIEAVSKGLKKTASVNQKLLELEEQKENLEQNIENTQFEIDKVKNQVLNAKIMHESLQKFSQICDKATPEELKELIPLFVEKVVWTPTEIKIALFEQPIQKEPIDNDPPSSGGGGSVVRVSAPQVSKWLPR